MCVFFLINIMEWVCDTEVPAVHNTKNNISKKANNIKMQYMLDSYTEKNIIYQQKTRSISVCYLSATMLPF